MRADAETQDEAAPATAEPQPRPHEDGAVSIVVGVLVAGLIWFGSVVAYLLFQ